LTPIKPEDRPKLIALSVALVGMTGFIGKTVVGIVSKPQATAAATSSTSPTAVATTSAATGLVVAAYAEPAFEPLSYDGPADPFRKIVDVSSRSAPIAAPRMRIVPSTYGRGLSGSLPPVSPLPPVGGAIGVPQPNGIEVTPVASAEPSIRLDGVMADDKKTAMVTVDGRTDIINPGQSMSGYVLERVTDQTAVFRTPRGRFELRVGDARQPGTPLEPLNTRKAVALVTRKPEPVVAEAAPVEPAEPVRTAPIPTAPVRTATQPAAPKATFATPVSANSGLGWVPKEAVTAAEPTPTKPAVRTWSKRYRRGYTKRRSGTRRYGNYRRSTSGRRYVVRRRR